MTVRRKNNSSSKELNVMLSLIKAKCEIPILNLKQIRQELNELYL
jgi:hypothetical protein